MVSRPMTNHSAARRTLLALPLALAACGSDYELPQAPPPEHTEFRLGPGDKLQVTVFGNQDLSGPVVVSPEGKISLPLLGDLQAENRTVPEITQTLRQRLDREFVVNAQVTVEVANYRPFYILGEVQKPGNYPYAVGLDVRQAIAIAGGFTRRAATGSYEVVRETPTGRRAYSLQPGDLVLPGDTIEVLRRIF
jgi:polysaccharide export outer membrane protein